MFWVYILRCGDGTYYTGHTDDLAKRIVEHEARVFGGYTSNRKLLELVFHQGFSTRPEALQAEQQIKKWSQAKKGALVKGDWNGIRKASKKTFKS